MKFELNQYNRNVSNDDLIADVRQVAAEIKKNTVTRKEQDEHGRFKSITLIKRFGSWRNACAKATLEMTRTLPNTPDEELYKNLEEVWTRLGRQPVYSEVAKPTSRFHGDTYCKRFGGWRKALEAFVSYVNDEQTPQSEETIRDWKVEPTTKHKTSRTINWRLRVKVWMRDNHKCQLCGRSPATDPTIVLHVDHIKAWANGGETVLENLQTLCSRCNLGKSNLEFTNTETIIEVQNV